MARTPTTTDTTVEWQERVTDPDSDSLTLSLVLDAVDYGSGFTSDGTDSSNLSWLSFTKTENPYNGGDGVEALMDIVANKSGLDQDYKYRFKITANDGSSNIERTLTLSIQKPPFSYNGTMMWTLGTGDKDTVNTYDLGTEWDVTTLSSTTGQVDLPEGNFFLDFFLKPDGTRLFLARRTLNNSYIFEYELTTPWDITTQNFVRKVDFYNEIENNIWSFDWAKGGEVIFVGDRYDNRIIKFVFSTPWDITTLSSYTTLSTSYAIGSLHASENGKVLLTTVDGLEGVKKHRLGTPYDLSTSTLEEDLIANDDINQKGSNYGPASSIFFRDTGSKLFISWKKKYNEKWKLTRFDLSTDYQISSFGNRTEIDIPNDVQYQEGFFIGGP